MPQPAGPKEGRETSAQQAERVAREILQDLEPVLAADTSGQLETLKGRINSLITGKLQGLNEDTKRTARGKLREFLTRDVHAATLPDILKRNADKRNVVLTVNEEGQRAEKPVSGGGGYGPTGTLNPQETSGQIGIAALITAIGVGGIYLLNKTKENTKKVGGWLKYLFGSALLFTGALFGLKTWAEFQQGKEALRKAFEETQRALENARQHLDQATEGPRRAIDLVQVRADYQRLQQELSRDARRGDERKIQEALNRDVFSKLRADPKLREQFKKLFVFPNTILSRNDFRVQFTVTLTQTGFEVLMEERKGDDRLSLAETVGGLMGIFSNDSPQGRNYYIDVASLSTPARRDALVILLREVPAVCSLTLEKLTPLAACRGFSAAKNAVSTLNVLPQGSSDEMVHALWFLAIALSREPKSSEGIVTQYPGLAEEFMKGMTIDGRLIVSRPDMMKLTVGQVLDRTGPYLRILTRIHRSTGDGVTAKPVDQLLRVGFDPRESLVFEVESPTVVATLRQAFGLKPGYERTFLGYCARHADVPLSFAVTVRETQGLSAEEQQEIQSALSRLQEFMHVFRTGKELNALKGWITKISSSPSVRGAADALERSLQTVNIGDVVQILLYAHEVKRAGEFVPDAPQALGRSLLIYKAMELIGRVEPTIAKVLYEAHTS